MGCSAWELHLTMSRREVCLSLVSGRTFSIITCMAYSSPGAGFSQDNDQSLVLLVGSHMRTRVCVVLSLKPCPSLLCISNPRC